jgi:O-antigen/teichoic acid export membrane protein
MVFVIIGSALSLVLSYAGAKVAGVAGLYLGLLIAGACMVGSALWRTSRRWPDDSPSLFAGTLSELRRQAHLVAYLGSAYVISFTQPLAFLTVRSAMVTGRSATEAGHFQAAFVVSSVLSMLLIQTGRLYLEPQVNREMVPRARVAFSHEYIRVIAGLMIVGALPLSLFPDVAIAMLFSRSFVPVAPYLFLFVLADCLLVWTLAYLAALRAQDDMAWAFGINLSGNVALAALAWLLVPRWGIGGAAAAFLVSRVSTIGCVLIRMRRLTGARMPAETLRAVTYLAAAVTFSGVITLGIAGNSAIGAALGVPLRLVVLIAFLAGGLWMLHSDERRWLQSTAVRAITHVRNVVFRR